MSLSGYAFTGNVYQIGNANIELTFSGQLVTVRVNLGGGLSGQTIRIYRSMDHGTSYLNYATCIVTV
jgi:hypothetical protein